MTVVNEEIKVAKISLQELVEAGEEIANGVGANVWYFAEDHGDEETAETIEDIQNSMLYVDRAMPDLVAAVRMLNDLVTAGVLSKDHLEKASALTAKFVF